MVCPESNAEAQTFAVPGFFPVARPAALMVAIAAGLASQVVFGSAVIALVGIGPGGSELLAPKVKQRGGLPPPLLTR